MSLPKENTRLPTQFVDPAPAVEDEDDNEEEYP